MPKPKKTLPPKTIANGTTETDGKSLTSIAFERIREDIMLCRLSPGSPLRITALAAHYAVGATAIREALSRLVTEGWVKSADQRGFSVSAVSGDELLDLTQTRINIESWALMMAIERGDVEWESNLTAAFHRMSRFTVPITEKDTPALTSAHRQFHAALLAGCNSPCTLSVCGLLYDKSERYRNLSALPPAKARDKIKEHRRVMDAALERDAAKACKLLAAHFTQTTHNVMLSINQSE